MELYKLQNKKYMITVMVLLALFLALTYKPKVKANNGWLTETSDGYYSVGNNLEVKIDIVNGNKESINNTDNLFYNGQSVYIKLDWRAVEDVTLGTSLKFELPVNKPLNQVSFEAPLFKNTEIISDDGIVLTALKKDGATITSFFSASEQKPIKKDSFGTVHIPHNIFVNPDAGQVPAHTMEIVLTADNNEIKPIRKEVGKISNGLKADTFVLKNKINNQEINTFDSLTGNKILLAFNYYSGDKGINRNDSLLIKLSDYQPGNKVSKLSPFSFETIELKDSKGKTIGTADFLNRSKDDKDTYMRLEFNDGFSGMKNIKGDVAILLELSFSKTIEGQSIIAFFVNNIEQNLSIQGPVEAEKITESRFDIYLKDFDILRKNIVVNERDLSRQNLSESSGMFKVIPNAVVEENIEGSGYYIDANSIRIIKTLSKKANSDNQIISFGLDSMTLKDDLDQKGSDRICQEKEYFGSQRGISVDELEQYLGQGNLISYKKDNSGNIVGFSLVVGNINEPKGVNGEYVVVNSDGSTERVPKDNRAFGYIIYYNTIKADVNIETSFKTEVEDDKKSGTLRILLVDENGIPVSNAKVQLKLSNKVIKTTDTNSDGYCEFDNLEEGKYTLEEAKDSNVSFKTVKFDVTESNINNLDLKVQDYNKKRNDINFEAKKYEDGNGTESENFVNIIESEPEKVKFVLENKDSETQKPIAGAEFDIYSETGFKLSGNLGKIKISDKGEATSSELPLGKYYLVQTKSGTGYSLDNSKISVELDSAKEVKTYSVLSSNMAPIEIYNYYLDNGVKKPLEGAKFKIYSYSDLKNELEILTTDENGNAVSKKLAYERYSLEQIYVPPGYSLLDSNQPVNISSRGINEKGNFMVSFENKTKDNKNNTVNIENDNTPLGSVRLDNDTPKIESDDILQEIENYEPPQEQIKNNPTTDDDFKIGYLIGTATLMLFLLILKKYFSNKNLYIN